MNKQKETSMKFFNKIIEAENPRDDMWICKCKKILKQKNGSGYTNLFKHIMSNHINEITQIQNTPTLDSFVNKKHKNIFAWIEFIIDSNSPISCVDQTYLRNICKLDPICSNTLRDYMKQISSLVEKNISTSLPARFGIMFDGWSEESDHYVAIFALYEKDGDCIKVIYFRIFIIEILIF